MTESGGLACTGTRASRSRSCVVALGTVLIAVAALLLPPSAADARTIHVPGDASTVQGALDLAVEGDTVLVAPGTYLENLVVSKTITLASHYHTTGDPSYIERTILDGRGLANVISVGATVGPTTMIVGFTVRNASNGIATSGGTVNVFSNRITANADGIDCQNCRIVARGNVIRGNTDDGVDADGASELTIEQNVIASNGDSGIEVGLDPYTGPMLNIVIRNNDISMNSEDGIQLVDYTGLSSRVFFIEGNLIESNVKAGLGMMANGSNAEDLSGAAVAEPIYLTNNTFVGNDHAVTGGANVTARNNIFASSVRLGVKNVAGTSTVAYSLFWQNGADYQGSNIDLSTSIFADPMFDADFNLRAGSPAIDAGVALGSTYNGVAPDLGSYESAPTTAPLGAHAGASLTGTEGASVTFAGSAVGGTGPYSFSWQFGDGTSDTMANPVHVYTDNGTMTATLTVTDATGATATAVTAVTIVNAAPTADTGGPYAGTPGSPIVFGGSARDASVADVAAGLQFVWDFGDGITATGNAPTHVYAAPGTYTVRLTVTDKDGGAGSATTTVKVAAIATGPVRAFPGAEGFGANAIGGRGGRVIEVTNLNDSGPGSLRAAVEASGPRIVVFRVGGTIELERELSIKNPFITIAGQTAPGGGIAIKNHAINTTGTLTIDTSEVIIRYIRVRPGPGVTNADALTIRAGSNIIIDHCSFTWSVDEGLNTWYSPSKITIQWSLVAEGLHRSTHHEGPHSMGLFLGSDKSHSISVHHNLIAHNNQRNPGVKTQGIVDVVNNVVYNYGSGNPFPAGWVGDQYGRIPLNFVGNYYKAGPSSDRTKAELTVYEFGLFGFDLFVQGNIGPHRPTGTEPESAVVSANGHKYLVGVRNPAPLVTTTSALEAYTQVLADVGATVPRRDPVDERIVNEVRTGTGRIIDHPDQVGGWPVLQPGTPPLDTDRDGMPDEWEVARGLNPSVDDSAGDRDGDGYTNIEEYLNSLTSAARAADNVAPAAPSGLTAM